MTDIPGRISTLSRLIDERLELYLTPSLDRLRALDDALIPVADELGAFVAGGGKRLRPVLVLLGHEIAGGDAADAVGPALAVELLHTCALLHDDLIDAADTRRGRPATHVAFAERHRGLGHAGDAERFGAAMAVLLGDLAFVQADEAFLSSGLSDGAVLAGLRMFNELRVEVMAGQTLDVIAAASRTVDVDQVLTVATLKSGRYSVTRPLQLGAVLAGGDAAVVAGLQAVGDPLGLAFQLGDDLLGVFGDADETGKPVASDLAEGKRTILVAEAANRLTAAEWEVVDSALGRGGLSEADAQRVRDLLRSCGAVDAVRERIDALVAEGRAAIAALPASQARDDLRAFTDWFVTRRT